LNYAIDEINFEKDDWVQLAWAYDWMAELQQTRIHLIVNNDVKGSTLWDGTMNRPWASLYETVIGFSNRDRTDPTTGDDAVDPQKFWFTGFLYKFCVFTITKMDFTEDIGQVCGSDTLKLCKSCPYSDTEAANTVCLIDCEWNEALQDDGSCQLCRTDCQTEVCIRAEDCINCTD
jgi:hypothetical protein